MEPPGTWGYWQYGYLRGAEGKQQLPQVTRPLTRGFCAQLLANAQAAAADKNRVESIGAVNVDGVAAANGEFQDMMLCGGSDSLLANAQAAAADENRVGSYNFPIQ
nr:G2/mitotic-specific cyclin S13-7-like [Ipomoea batatas]